MHLPGQAPPSYRFGTVSLWRAIPQAIGSKADQPEHLTQRVLSGNPLESCGEQRTASLNEDVPRVGRPPGRLHPFAR
jgi:hypothetical protein